MPYRGPMACQTMLIKKGFQNIGVDKIKNFKARISSRIIHDDYIRNGDSMLLKMKRDFAIDTIGLSGDKESLNINAGEDFYVAFSCQKLLENLKTALDSQLPITLSIDGTYNTNENGNLLFY